MKNKDGFDSWLLCQGMPEADTRVKVSAARCCEIAIGKYLDDWDRCDVAALRQVRGGPIGAALRTPGRKGSALFSVYAHSAKLYVGYRVQLTSAGPDLDRLTGTLAALEELCPSRERWARAIGAA